MRRSRFLPVYFTLLVVAFAIVLIVRLRSDMRQPSIAAPEQTRPPARKSVAASPVPLTTSPQLPSGIVQQATPPARLITSRQPNATELPASGYRQRTNEPAPKQSFFSRVLAPIAHAFTKPTPAGAKPLQSQQTPQSSASSSRSTGSSGSSGSSGSAPDKQEQSKDPNSDTTPPQLQSIAFIPPEIQDGQATTVLVIASDDLSGIRGISGTLSSPSGKALQGFATERESEGSNRYVGHITIAKSAEQGMWKVSFLNMSDNASNSITLSYAQGTVPQNAVLHVVSSNSDNTPPTLKNVWVDKRAIQGGEKDAIFVQAEDDNSGVSLVSAVFHSPSNVARIGAGCQHSGDSDTWTCELSVPTCIDCGDWQLEQITLQDKANNIATFRMDNPLVAATKINIAGAACDNTPPVLQSVTLDTNQVTLGDRAAIVTVTIVATDDNCGVAGASGQFIGPSPGSGGFFPLMQSGDVWTGRITLDPRAARGTWRINTIQINDAGHNLKVYGASDPLLQNAVFQVR
ncbi:MAG TPA: hypothetical protein VJ853_00780 [Thermoanaerobaculia bacterium]|nr:hypothetical protein [Thermoanaerobaculia bacterium]